MEEERAYRSIGDMRRRRRQLKHEIAANERAISGLWNNLFHRRRNRRPASRARRLSSVVATGVNVVDGALLAWKLYKRFKK
ncbi:MAG: hypothetical protein LUC22_07110 [Prevotella sp.]|nr:hypothetical protein [Prevotella sp.]